MKMIDAESTWAIVVGIDDYEHLDHLTGAARDAVASVTWLRALGVPDTQILFHAMPSEDVKAEVAALGLDCRGCSSSELEDSFLELQELRGTKLFIFLSGHGLFEPGGDEVFLTSDATKRVPRNLGIERYLKYLRSLDFRRQFIVMDGCLNLPYSSSRRAAFHGQGFDAIGDPPVRVDVEQYFCFSARFGQRAVEGEGRGLFSRALLEALDPEKPNPRCVVIDDTTGARGYDLFAAVNDVASPIVANLAAKNHQIRQTPGVRGDTHGPVRIVEFSPQQVAKVRVSIQPEDALPDIGKVTIWSHDIDWRRIVPTPPDGVPAQFDSVLPAGLRWQIGCSVVAGSEWMQPGEEPLQSDGDQDVAFTLVRESAGLGASGAPVGPRAGTPVAEINTVDDATGDTFYNLSDYAAIQTVLDTRGLGVVSLEAHESGPVLYATNSNWRTLRTVALAVASEMDRSLPTGYSVRVHGFHETEPTRTSIAFPLTEKRALGLVGFGMENASVVIDEDVTRSLRDLLSNPEVRVEPGPHTVRVSVPWGVWTDRVIVENGEREVVKLPGEIGVPPLRVSLLAHTVPHRADPLHSIVTVGTHAIPHLLARGGDSFTVASQTEWKGHLWLPPVPPIGWESLATIARKGARLVFPLNRNGAVAVQSGDHPRAEPLSTTTIAHWDRLVAAGRLDDLSPEEATELTNAKLLEPLLGLAGAYACFAQQRDDYLDIVLGNLQQIDPELPDVGILAAALVNRSGSRDVAKARAHLKKLEHDQVVPVFSWGIAIGAIEAERHGLDALAARYNDISRRLVPGSVWTLWEEDA